MYTLLCAEKTENLLRTVISGKCLLLDQISAFKSHTLILVRHVTYMKICWNRV